MEKTEEMIGDLLIEMASGRVSGLTLGKKLATMHPTNQQQAMKAIYTAIVEYQRMHEDEKFVDGRNKAAYDFSKVIAELPPPYFPLI